MLAQEMVARVLAARSPELARGAHHSESDFTAIGNEEFLDHKYQLPVHVG